ncbi:hypothetical protein [Candidatus Thiosymbion oneisti]|uniref:hypothetical protein n=1 Tax=Candidatus Thiosymbion oneisti TaxID=589554 RepID=UPI001061F9AF|nr:hypothetical protein [Candidatus Thiosymbion oneisti]
MIKVTLGIVLWTLVMILGSQSVFDAPLDTSAPLSPKPVAQPPCPPESVQGDEDLRIQVEELRQALTKAEEELAKESVARERKEDELLTVRQSLEELTAEHDRLKRDLNTQTKALEVERGERRLAETERERMEGYVEDLDRKMEQSEQTIDRLQPENEDLHRQLASQEKQNKRLERQLRELKGLKEQLRELEGQCHQPPSASACESAARTVRSYLEKVNARLVDEAISHWVENRRSQTLRKTISTAGSYSDIRVRLRSCDKASGVAVVFARFRGHLDGETTEYAMNWQLVRRGQNWRILTQELSPSR